MSGPRIYELSKELRITNKDVMEFLQSKGITFKSHSSSVDIADAQLVRRHFNKLAEAAAKVAAEEKDRAKKAAAAAAKPAAAPGAAPPAPVGAPAAPAVPVEKPAVVPSAATAAPAARVEALSQRPHEPAPAPRPAVAPSIPAPVAPRPSSQPPFPRPSMPSRPGGGRPPFMARRPVGPPPRRGKRPPRPSHRAEVLPPEPAKPPADLVLRKVQMAEGVTVKEFAEKVEIKAKDIIKALLDKGVFVSINHSLDSRLIEMISPVFNLEVEVLSFEKAAAIQAEQVADTANLQTRHPVVTIMGHVDHGKTSLLDAIRSTNVAGKEAGGITQRIGAYKVRIKDRKIVFLDTPGHEAFTKMRSRGAKVTDIVVLVVAADDGVMPQTVEAIHHSKAAGVPIIVAINKIDKPGADPQRVKRELADHELVAEDWGGQTVMVEVSAKKQINLDGLLEMILLVADMSELKADATRAAAGTVLEARLDRGRGPVATVLVQNGVLNIGDNVLVGTTYGKVRAMLDDSGERVKRVGPSSPVEVLGLVDVPQPGDHLQVVDDIAKARQIGTFRQMQVRESLMMAARPQRLTLDHLFQQIKEGGVKELPLILKADVQGSVEVLAQTLTKLSTDKVRVRIIHSGAGAITETDVLLASASNAIIIGFNVRPERKAVDLARAEEVDIRLHTIIYEITNEIRNAMEGLLEPTIKETYLGTADVRDTFKVPKFGTVAGCFVSEGKITRNAECRLIRDNVVVFEGRIGSLKRFKDDASEVKVGLECGIGIERYNDVKVGDVIEAFVRERIKQELAETR